MLKRLKPSKFEEFEAHKDHLEGKIILYTDRSPRTDNIEFDGMNLRLESKINIDLPGVVTNPSNSIYKVTVMYEKDIFLSNINMDGVLFVYTGFKPSLSKKTVSANDAKQLLFVCYSLRKF